MDSSLNFFTSEDECKKFCVNRGIFISLLKSIQQHKDNHQDLENFYKSIYYGENVEEEKEAELQNTDDNLEEEEDDDSKSTEELIE